MTWTFTKYQGHSTSWTFSKCPRLLSLRAHSGYQDPGDKRHQLNLILRSFKNETSTLGDPSGEESDAAVYQLTKPQWLSVS